MHGSTRNGDAVEAYLMTDFTYSITFLVAPVLNTLSMSILQMIWQCSKILIYDNFD